MIPADPNPHFVTTQLFERQENCRDEMCKLIEEILSFLSIDEDLDAIKSRRQCDKPINNILNLIQNIAKDIKKSRSMISFGLTFYSSGETPTKSAFSCFLGRTWGSTEEVQRRIYSCKGRT